MNRRQFVRTTVAGLSASALASRVTLRPGQPARTRLLMLGTAGGPRPWRTRSAPAQAIVVNNTVYVVDCGDGVVRQLALADVPLRDVRHVFVTHHHSDHNADYGTLILLAWASGLRTRVDTWGPPPLARMTDLFFEMNAADIDARTTDEGRPPLQPRLTGACYNTVAPGYAFSLSGIYLSKGDQFAEVEVKTSPVQASREIRAQEAENALNWFRTLTGDVFG